MRKSYVVRDGELVEKQNLPSPPRLHVIPDIQPYRVVGPEYGKVITSRSKHREYLKTHGLIERGSQKPEWMKANDR